MFQKLIPTAALVAVLGWAASAEPPVKDSKSDPKFEPKTAPKSDPATFELRLKDDTVVKVALLDPTVELVTKYGKLSIPAAELRRLEFGFRYPEGLEAKIDKGVADLGASEFRTREDAEQMLADAGHYAIPALRRAVKSQDPEVVRRAQSVLKFTESKLGEGRPELRDYDVIETVEFTVKGRLELNGLKVRTKYFGDATIKLTDIKSFRSVGAANPWLTLDAAKYGKMNQADWLETAIEVTAGEHLEVTATGKIDQWPQGPGQYMCEASGLPGYGAGGAVPGGGQRIGVPGQLVGRIGPNGAPFIIGASYRGKAIESGKLYLRISPSPWNCDSSGSYKVTVHVTSP
jgi:hypothetical protein